MIVKLDSWQHQHMQLKAAEQALAKTVKLRAEYNKSSARTAKQRAKYNKTADARIKSLNKLMAKLREELQEEAA